MRKLRRIIYGSLAALLLLALLGWVWFASRPAAFDSATTKLAMVTFLNYSNAPDGRVFAWFSVTNPTDSRILYFPPTILVLRAGDRWRNSSSYHQGGELPPHGSVSVSFAKPEKAEAWKVSVMNAPLPSRAEYFFVQGLRRLPWDPAVMERWIHHNFSTPIESSSSEPRTD